MQKRDPLPILPALDDRLVDVEVSDWLSTSLNTTKQTETEVDLGETNITKRKIDAGISTR